jgi:hypothetical protein
MNPSSNDKPKIIITGDSWGCGEWGDTGGKYTILHLGIEQYFTDSGYEVINISKGNNSNIDSLASLTNFLNSNQITASDIILFIKTDPIRELRPYDTFTDEIIKNNGINALINKLSSDLYHNIDVLAKKYNTKIYLIGGNSSLIPFINDFKNLTPLVSSWVKLMFDNLKIISHDHFADRFIGPSDWTITNISIKSLDKDFLHKIVNELYEIHTNTKLIFKELIFHPDGCHPNRTGHKMLFDYITKELKL